MEEATDLAGGIGEIDNLRVTFRIKNWVSTRIRSAQSSSHGAFAGKKSC
jgi:hypothetical protein